MNTFQCPGAVRIREPIPEFFKCPNCGGEVEIWTHEQSRNCGRCGTEVFKEHVPSCVEWCKYAIDCVGEDAYHRFLNRKKKEATDSGNAQDNQDR